jgi:hypothetical protein
MKCLHDNGFRVITFAELGYDENSNSLYIKKLLASDRQSSLVNALS